MEVFLSFVAPQEIRENTLDHRGKIRLPENLSSCKFLAAKLCLRVPLSMRSAQSCFTWCSFCCYLVFMFLLYSMTWCIRDDC